MDIKRRKWAWLAIGAMLASAGVCLGMLASTLTTRSIAWRAPAFAPAATETTGATVDQQQAGRAWARSAFDGGLRQCPEMNPEFLTACQAEMTALGKERALVSDTYREQAQVADIALLPPEPDLVSDAPEFLPTFARGEDRDNPPMPADPGYDPTPVNYPAVEDWERGGPQHPSDANEPQEARTVEPGN